MSDVLWINSFLPLWYHNTQGERNWKLNVLSWKLDESLLNSCGDFTRWELDEINICGERKNKAYTCTRRDERKGSRQQFGWKKKGFIFSERDKEKKKKNCKKRCFLQT